MLRGKASRKPELQQHRFVVPRSHTKGVPNPFTDKVHMIVVESGPSPPA
jgi:hypothetical protein